MAAIAFCNELLQSLMQTIRNKIRLLPAWPKDWEVDFKLHATHQTTVEGKVCTGKVISLKVISWARRYDVIVRR
jgi:hypothetical protein